MFESYTPPEGYRFAYSEETVSTNSDAMEQGEGWIVAAGSQTGGRGRMGRSFSSEPGGLYFSVSLRPSCPMKEAMSLPLAAAVCARNAIGGNARIKWPNDILVDGKKVCGILCEGRNGVIVLGFGINIANALPPELDRAGRVDASAEKLMADIISALARLIAGYPDNRPDILQEYCDHCDTLMQFVDVIYRGMPLYGFACAVDKYGGLMVMTQESHTVVTVYSGEATIVPKRDGEDPVVPNPCRI